MNRNNEAKAMLNSILLTTQMGQMGIRSGLESIVTPELRNAMLSQLREYNSIEREANNIASTRNWKLKDADPLIRRAMNTLVKIRLTHGNSDSKVAEMMIRGNTRGMVAGLRDLHRMQTSDNLVCTLSRRLIDCEQANIMQMQGFL